MLVALAVLPDVDVVGFHAGIAYGDPLGHRGLSHSLLFAIAVGTAATALCFRDLPVGSSRWLGVATLASLAAASHGLLDAATDAGLGVGFFLPFDETRYFFDWRPLRTSPLSPAAFVSPRGVAILANEAVYVGIPTALAAGLVVRLRRPGSGAARR